MTKCPWFLALALSLGLWPASAMAMSENHPDRAWSVLETPHFSVHFYKGEEQSARRMAKAAESNLPRLEKDFGVEIVDKIPLIVSRDNFFNGSAEPVKSRIQLDPVLAASSVIGTDRFVAHELTHVVSFLALQRDQALSRLNLLSTMPNWFLEGLAQYEAEYWYTENDRMLRLHTLNNSLLTSTERDNFPLLGVAGGAAGYNEGYSLTRYLFDTYGKDKIATLFKTMREGQESIFTKALEATFGKSFQELQTAWQEDLKKRYAAQTKDIQEHASGSIPLVPSERREVNVAPALSPDGKKLAYLTSRNQDGYLYLRGHVMGFLSLGIADADGANAQILSIGKGRISSFAWSPDGAQLVVSAVAANSEDEPTLALFLYDLKTKTTTQLTKDASATDPAWNPRTNQIAYVETRDGQTRLQLLDVKSRKCKPIPFEGLGERHVNTLSWSPDGRQLAGSIYATGEGGKIALIDPESGHVRMLTEGKGEINDHHASWSQDGRSLVFSSDRDGMQNLYRLSLKGHSELQQLTRVYTGASHPFLDGQGQIFYVSYRAVGSEIRLWSPSGGEKVAYQPPKDRAPGIKVASSLNSSPIPGHQLPDTWSIHGYESTLTNDLWVPQLTTDERGSQIGALAQYSDVLNKQQLGLDVRLGIMSQRFSYAATYVNRMSAASWGVTLFDAPNLAMSPQIDPARLYDSLYWERERGVQLVSQASLAGAQKLTAALGLSYVSMLDAPPSGKTNGLRNGRVQALSLGWTDARVKNTTDADLNPSDGYRLGAGMTLSDRAIGSEFNFSQYALGGEHYFPVVPDWRHNLTMNWHVAWNQGEAMPLFLGGVQGGGPITPLRGYNVGSFVGNRLATMGMNYTFPINGHIDYQFGALYLHQLYGSAFIEAGDAWSQGDAFHPHATAGAELRIKTAFMARQVVTFRIGVSRRLSPDGTWGMYVSF